METLAGDVTESWVAAEIWNSARSGFNTQDFSLSACVRGGIPSFFRQKKMDLKSAQNKVIICFQAEKNPSQNHLKKGVYTPLA